MVDRTHGETKLWESFIKGETAAFEEVYRRYYSLLYSYGIRMVGDRELVADTIQNLFVKLILNCRNLHYTDNVKAYLLCSFRNKLLDAFQSLRPNLYYVKELSHQEISAILGMNPQSSKNLLSRTLARLREFFFSVSTIWIFSILVHCVHVPVRSVWAFHFS